MFYCEGEGEVEGEGWEIPSYTTKAISSDDPSFFLITRLRIIITAFKRRLIEVCKSPELNYENSLIRWFSAAGPELIPRPLRPQASARPRGQRGNHLIHFKVCSQENNIFMFELKDSRYRHVF